MNFVKEEFKCAAIRYELPDGTWVERHGRRHHEILKVIKDAGDIEFYKRKHEHGFIIGFPWSARFVSTEEATEIAKERGIPMIGGVLTSEDLW